MTIHNLKFQGIWDTKRVQGHHRASSLLFCADKLEAYKDANYLKEALSTRTASRR